MRLGRVAGVVALVALAAPVGLGGSSASTLGPSVLVVEGTYDSAVGALSNETVLQMNVVGFPMFAAARARQCVGADAADAADGAVCGNHIEVQFGEGGTASFQYRVVDDIADGGGCRLNTRPCFIVIENVDGEGSARVRTLFHDAVPPSTRVRVEPATGLQDVETVRVFVDGLPPGASARVVLCALPVEKSSDRCGVPGPVAEVVAGADGTVAVDLVVRAGPVGRDGVFCGRGSKCAVTVLSDEAFVQAAPVRLAFAKPAGAQYDTTRLAIGLALSLLLLAVTGWLVVRSDWSAIGEEAAPEIDEAEYADLDAIIAAMPPEEEFEPSR